MEPYNAGMCGAQGRMNRDAAGLVDRRHVGAGQRGDRDGDAETARAWEVFEWLPPDLQTTMASLDGAPEPIATAVIQLLPFGSRAALITLGLAQPQADDTHPAAVVELTRLAFAVMQVCAIAAEANPDAVNDWLQQAREAASFTDEA